MERSFALFFGRFRRFKYLDMNRLDYIPITVLAACVMHNICIDAKDEQLENYINEGINNVFNDANEGNENDRNINDEGRNVRDEMCRILYQQRPVI